MTDTQPNASAQPARRRGLVIAVACAAFAVGMVGVAHASVPLYYLFCQVTGYGGTTQRAETAPSQVIDRTVLVRFDGNVAPGLPWKFGPNDRAAQESAIYIKFDGTNMSLVPGAFKSVWQYQK